MPVGEKVLGRIFNVTGDTVDNLGPCGNEETRPIHRQAPTLLEQDTSQHSRNWHQSDRLDLSLHQRRKGRGIRRSWSWQDRCRHGIDQQHRQGARRGYSVFAGVGERSQEGNDLYQEMSEAGVINQEDISKSKVALVYGQMNEPRSTHESRSFRSVDGRILS